MRVRLCPGVGLEGRLGCLALSAVVCKGHGQYPAFASSTVFVFFLFLLQTLQKWQLGFLVSLYLLGPEYTPTAS